MSESREHVQELSEATRERIYRILGEGVAQAWSDLPQAIQHELFESAVKTEGEQMREAIAVFLHIRHHRTKSGVQAKAMPEPDSKGG